MNTTQAPLYTSPMPHVHPWTPTQIADLTFDVTAARVAGRVVAVGDQYVGSSITGIQFYTGFAGCPARYYISTDAGGEKYTTLRAHTYVAMA